MALVDHVSAMPSPASGANLRAQASELIIDGVCQLWGKGENADEIYGEAAIAYIKENICEPLSVPVIAAHLGFRSRVYTLFRKYTGQTPVDYIVRLRIKAAERMLITEKLSISDIAFKSGFNSSCKLIINQLNGRLTIMCFKI